MKKIRVFEAFSGYGSQSIALRNIGVDYEVVAISEIDKYAIRAYEAIHGKANNLGDISKIDIKDIPEHDLFTYSFPCQDISIAGRQMSLEEGSETRSSLLWECKKIIEYCKPKYLLMENVKNLISKKHKPYFDKWLDYLESLEYTNYWKVLNAKDYRVPQNRERVFVVSILGEHKPYEFPKPIKLEKRLKDILEIEIDDKYYLSEKVQKRFKQTKSDNGENSIIGTTAPEFRTIGQRDLVYSKEGIMGTLVATDYKQPKQILETIQGDTSIRKLTPRECFRLMGLNDKDIDKIQMTKISDTQQYKLAGNSIVVPVLEEIFKNLFKV